jgi:HK97 family phage portal protein
VRAVPWWRFGRRATNQAVSVGDPLVAAMLGGGFGHQFTPPVSEHTAMSISALFRAVSLISGTIGALPLRTLSTSRDGTRERTGSFLDSPGRDQQTPFEWKELCAVHLLLHGNAYCQHVYNAAGALAGLNLIHPLAVTVKRDADAAGGRLYEVALGDGTRRTFDALTMTHIPGISLDGLRGLSPITLARLSLGTAIAGDRAANRQFVNGAMVSGLITPVDDEDLTEDEALVVKETVQRAMTGVENAGEMAVINRRLKIQPWTLSPEDAQFLGSRSFQIDEIGRWYGVPPHLLGQVDKSTSWGQGIAEQNRGLARYTLTPWTSRIEQRLSRLIAGSKIVEFDYTAFVAPSPEDEIRLLLSQLNGGLMTANECRRVRNMPPVEGGDVLRIPAGAADPNKPAGAAPAPAGSDPEKAAA